MKIERLKNILPKSIRVHGTISLSAVTSLHRGENNRNETSQVFMNEIPKALPLLSSYPSPFNPTTTIKFVIANAGFVTLKVFNTLGQQVATLMNNEFMEEGGNEIEFNASNFPSGVYFVHMELNGENGEHSLKTSKIVLMK